MSRSLTEAMLQKDWVWTLNVIVMGDDKGLQGEISQLGLHMVLFLTRFYFWNGCFKNRAPQRARHRQEYGAGKKNRQETRSSIALWLIGVELYYLDSKPQASALSLFPQCWGYMLMPAHQAFHMGYDYQSLDYTAWAITTALCVI